MVRVPSHRFIPEILIDTKQGRSPESSVRRNKLGTHSELPLPPIRTPSYSTPVEKWYNELEAERKVLEECVGTTECGRPRRGLVQ